MKRIEGYSAILAVKNLGESIDFFTQKLGFTLGETYGKPMYFASVSRDGGQSISLLCMASAKVTNNSIGTLSFQCHDIESLYDEFLANDVEIDERLDIKEYGMKEFRILDPNGYIFYFQERVAQQA